MRSVIGAAARYFRREAILKHSRYRSTDGRNAYNLVTIVNSHTEQVALRRRVVAMVRFDERASLTVRDWLQYQRHKM